MATTAAERPAWMAALNGDPIPWLLEKDNACVRYRTLTELLGRDDSDAEVAEARRAVWDYAPVKKVIGYIERKLAEHDRGERQKGPDVYPFRDLEMLARLGIPSGHPTIARLCERFLEWDLGTKGQCYHSQAVAGIACYGNVADHRALRLLDTVMQAQPFADGNRPGAARFSSRGEHLGSHSCIKAVTRSLRPFIAIPKAARTAEMNAFLRRGAEFLRAHRLYERNHSEFVPIEKGSDRFGLPFNLDNNTNILDLLDIATQIGLEDDPCLGDALRAVLSKQDERGRWKLDIRHRTDRPILASQLLDVEEFGKPSKWITLTVALQLKRSERLVSRMLAGDPIVGPTEPPPLPVFAHYPYRYDAADEQRVRDEWKTMGMGAVLTDILGFARTHHLLSGWFWDLAVGPESCREWCTARVRLVPAKHMKKAWPVCQIFFLSKHKRYTVKSLSDRLGIPIQDTSYPARKGSWVTGTLWRIKVSRWKREWDDVGVALKNPAEFSRVRPVLAEAYADIREEMEGW